MIEELAGKTTEELMTIKAKVEEILAERALKEKQVENVTLFWNEYKGSGKCWAARVEKVNGVIAKREFLKPIAQQRDGYTGKKVFALPLVENAMYELCEVGTKSKDDRRVLKVQDGKLVQV